MQDRLTELESRLADVERRLSALESTRSEAAAAARIPDEPTLGEGFVSSASTHIGHVLLIFGGAYLLRAITDSRFVPTGVGISMGASYALFWLFVAYRKGGIDRERASAAFYGGTSIVLALPLLVEAITRFELLSVGNGVAALAVFCALTLIVATTRNLRSLAWLVAGGGIVTAFAVMVMTHSALPVAAFLQLLGLGTLWSVYWRKWPGPQWLGALGADAGALSLIVFGTSDRWPIEPELAALFGITLLVIYLVSFAIHTHVRGRAVGTFEAAQAAIAAGIAFGAAGVASRTGQFDLMIIGLLSVLLGVSAYALMLSPESRKVRGRNYYFYAALGLLLVVVGSAIILPPTAAAALWSVMAVATAWASGRSGWMLLSLQCTILLLAAGVGSGILATGLQALAGEPTGGWPGLTVVHAGVALATVVCLFLPVAQHSARWGTLAGLPQLVVLALSVWEVGGLVVVYLAPIVAGVTGPEPNPAVLAALRTAVLSASSVTLALSSRHRRWPEARWLVYPVIIVVGIKLFIEDFPNGEPATLFLALAFVGSALLLVAKLLRRGPTGETNSARDHLDLERGH